MRGGRAFTVLLCNEWFKARKSLAFWLPLGFFTASAVLNHADAFVRGDDSATFPLVWSNIFGVESSFVLVFAALSLLLLTATEFSWRTARQNVIDGMSKSQWFWGKCLLLPIVGSAFIAVHILIPVSFALIRTDFGAVDGPLVPGSVWAALGGLVLAFLSACAFAFFLALAIRRTGAALGVWFIWVFPVESAMITPFVQRSFPDHAGWIEYLPWLNHFHLRSFAAYDAAAYERYVAPFEAAGRVPLPVNEPTWHLVTAGAWTAVFLGAALISFRRRDL